jgi:large subunit ribosomal protein L21
MYAVIEQGGKQLKVSKDMIVDLELFDTKPDAEVKFDKVLLVSDGKKDVKIGAPYVKGAHVTVKVIGENKDDKVTTFKYKNKTNYHRTIGHRQRYIRVKVTGITAE